MGLADHRGVLDDLVEREDIADVVVIGSGYGAGVCAARLAEAGAKVYVLERGLEFTAGKFPSKLQEILHNVQLDNSWFGSEHRLGLYNCHIGADLDVLVGCGLGGTSLINANVTIKPEPWVFEQDAQWPEAIRSEARSGKLDSYFQRAWDVLQPSKFPAARRTPLKLAAMEGHGGARCDINVHFDRSEKKNSIGIPQRPCTSCGNCVTGCNHRAKKTLCFTYLPIAKSFGAKILVRCDVQHLARSGKLWDVYYQRLEDDARHAGPIQRLRAKTVIVAAGVMGTAGILLRSRDLGLSLASGLGTKFSGNGDAIAFAFDCAQRLDSVGRPRGNAKHPTGATILGMIQRPTADPRDSVLIEEGAFPSGTAGALRKALGAVALLSGQDTRHGFLDKLRGWIDRLRDFFDVHTEDGALNRTLLFLLMGHDGAAGTVELDPRGRAKVRWPGLHKLDLFAREDALAHALTEKLGGTFVRDPLNARIFMNNLITVHPLGGGAMGDDGAATVDHAGRVRDNAGEVQRGLYVADASVIPTSLGVNPLWTISALAERIAAHVAVDLGHAATLDQVRASSTLKPGTTVSP